jgi:hypothetical protein
MGMGAGMLTCAEWKENRSNDNFMAFQLEAWVDAFLTGYNVGSHSIDFIPQRNESVAYYEWIDNYCSQNPLNKIVEAAVALKHELVSRARRKSSPTQ